MANWDICLPSTWSLYSESYKIHASYSVVVWFSVPEHECGTWSFTAKSSGSQKNLSGDRQDVELTEDTGLKGNSVEHTDSLTVSPFSGSSTQVAFSRI